MVGEEIRTGLFRRQDLRYRDVQAKIIPTLDIDSVIGVRRSKIVSEKFEDKKEMRGL